MSADDTNNNPADQFTKFWSDAMAQMTAGQMPTPGASPDLMAQMRKTFFAAMSEQADDYMRSEPFLEAMKQSMDHSLKFREQINEFLNQGLKSAQMPSRNDTDYLGELVRGMEERLTRKLDDLSRRVQKLETQRNGATPENKSHNPPRQRSKK